MTDNVISILQKFIQADGYDIVFDLEKSTPYRIYDKHTGDKYLDLFTFYASAPLGCNHPKVATKEFKKKLGQVAVNKPSNSESYTQEMAEFVETFSKIGMGKAFKHLFLISGGALAVENGLKAAFDWKVRKNFENGAEKELGQQVIHFEKAFHGRSGYTLSLTNTFDPRKTKYFPIFDWPRVTAPIITFPLADHLEEVKQLENQAISEIENAIDEQGDDIAALILEPIQGEGGDNHFRKEFFHQLRTICDKNDIMLIYDEVQTGVGLTGKMWAYEYYEIPDIVAFGKKMQVCGIMVSDRIDEVENNVFQESSRINSTWGGNLIDMVRATKYLQIIKEDRLVENARKMGDYLLKGLQNICEESNYKMRNARGKGLMCAFDLPSTEIRDNFRQQLFKNKVLILPCGEQSIRFRPPLCIKEDIIDEALNIMAKSCKQISQNK